jgi:hypothetical protein
VAAADVVTVEELWMVLDEIDITDELRREADLLLVAEEYLLGFEVVAEGLLELEGFVDDLLLGVAI